MRPSFFLLLPVLLVSAIGAYAQTYRPVQVYMSGGYQFTSAPPALGRFTDVLGGSPVNSGNFGVDLTVFLNRRWGLYLATRFSNQPRNWPAELQAAIERDYPEKLVRVALAREEWDGTVSQLFVGTRRRVYRWGTEWQPSLGIGFTEVQVLPGGADIKTPGSNALLNVVAYPSGSSPWQIAFSAEAGLRAAWPIFRSLYLAASAYYNWTKPSLHYDWSEIDQAALTLRTERLKYSQSRHMLGVSVGAGVYLGKK